MGYEFCFLYYHSIFFCSVFTVLYHCSKRKNWGSGNRVNHLEGNLFLLNGGPDISVRDYYHSEEIHPLEVTEEHLFSECS